MFCVAESECECECDYDDYKDSFCDLNAIHTAHRAGQYNAFYGAFIQNNRTDFTSFYSTFDIYYISNKLKTNSKQKIYADGKNG